MHSEEEQCLSFDGASRRVCTLRDGEVKSFFEVMVRAREKEEIVVGVKRRGRKAPELNPKDKDALVLSLKSVTSFVVIITGAPASQHHLA